MAERNTDTVPAMLTPGEFVVTKDAVENAGGPGFFYWLMNALDPGSKKPREDGYQHGGIVHSLLSRTQKKDKGPIYPKPEYTIPAGKNIFGQSTEKMGVDELIEMIMPTPPVGKISKTIRQLGKRGIDEYMIKPTRHEGIAKMGKLVTTGKGKKEVLENANLETLLMEVKKWARSRGIFEDVIKKQEGGSVGEEARETLLSMLSGGKYETSKDLPSIREQAIPALEFMTGAEHVPEGEEASLLNLALAIPFLGKFGKGAKPALSKYYASLFGHGSASKEKTKNYIRKMFKELPSMEYDKASNRIKRSAITKLRDESPSVRKMGQALYAEKSGKPWRMKLHEDKGTMEKGVKGFIKEAEDAHKYYYGKQHGGIIEDHSLMEYMMPTLDKRLGKPLKKMQFGGLVGVPTYDFQGNLVSPDSNFVTQQDWQQGVGSGSSSVPASSGLPSSPAGGMGFAGGLTGTAQQTLGTALGTASAYTPPISAEEQAQQSLQQPSSSYSTNIADVFKEAGLEIPDADYLSGIEAYDPTKQNRLRDKLSFKAFESSSPFASLGQEKEKIRQQRQSSTQTYMQGAQDFRKDWRESILAGIAEDMGSGIYGFEEREDDPYMG